uniref:Late embryogenesis abundant protein LEA-2 subgroup domain-containing protein n=1 Tax=Lotus japonicus TaxID=34305 RepID=I3S9U2_LOTJA|nr:unknown [Lotus japonicus]
MAQPQLNGATTAPPFRRRNRNPTTANCILGLICKILTTIIIIAAVAGFLFWLIVRPNVVKFRVTEASLTEFTYTNNTLHYNLALNITVRNPNSRVGLYYDSIETTAFYHDARFASQNLGNFFQHKKNTTVLSPVFKGQQVVPFSEEQGKKLNEDQGSEIYRINVKLLLKVRFKLGLFKTGKVTPKVRCELHVPLKSRNGTVSGAGFQATGCEWWIH